MKLGRNTVKIVVLRKPLPGIVDVQKACKKKSVHGVDELSDDSDDYFLNKESVGAIKAEECQRKIFATMCLRETKMWRYC